MRKITPRTFSNQSGNKLRELGQGEIAIFQIHRRFLDGRGRQGAEFHCRLGRLGHSTSISLRSLFLHLQNRMLLAYGFGLSEEI